MFQGQDQRICKRVCGLFLKSPVPASIFPSFPPTQIRLIRLEQPVLCETRSVDPRVPGSRASRIRRNHSVCERAGWGRILSVKYVFSVKTPPLCVPRVRISYSGATDTRPRENAIAEVSQDGGGIESRQLCSLQSGKSMS